MSYGLKISISRSDVITEVNKTCAYIGARTITAQEGKTVYGNVYADEYTAEMMTRFWNEACAGVVAVGKEFVVSAAGVDAETLSIEYALSDTYNTAMDGSVRQLIFSYIVWYILANWLEICGMTALAESYAQSVAYFLKQLDNMLYSRKNTRSGVAEGGTDDNQYGDIVSSFGGSGGGTGDETEGDNQYGDIVDSFKGEGSGSGDETEGDNQYGDIVDSFKGEGSGSGDETEGDNQYGDIVDSFKGEGSGSGDETEGDNQYGDTLPQNWGEMKVEHYWLGEKVK